MKLLIKICGMKDATNAKQVSELSPDLMGYIFYPKSERYVGDEPNPQIFKVKAKKVGVFVNESREKIIEVAERFGLEMIQLHGDESPELCTMIKQHLPVIKAIRIADEHDLKITDHYKGAINYFLFDHRSPLYGGSGKQFDHELLRRYNGNIPYFLSGGLGKKEVEYYRREREDDRMIGLDLNSRFEIKPGLKNVKDLKEALA